ncbi:MAG: 2-(1,2-epoxy-1,2-dihydrophenyl)acetyl-CoA isomerase PaaG [Pseudomonadota bacterium]
MDYETLVLAKAKGVARLVLNRPDQLNSFNERMHIELADALVDVQADDTVRCLLITGSGRGFCAGQDLGAVDIDSPDPIDLGAALETYYNPLVQRITGMNMPVIAAVNGVAAGAGANFALCCDIVIAARSASFIQAFSKIGLVPDCSGTWFLPRLLGPARALGLALTGDKLDAETAAEWGLIYQVVDDAALVDTTEQLAQRLASGPTAALALTKRLMASSWGNTLPEQLDLERDYQRALSQNSDFREGVRAFIEKRPAQFTGS